MGVLQQAVHAVHNGTDAALAEMILIGSEGQSVAQIVLQQVGNNIRRGIGGLLDRDGIGQRRVQNRNHRLHNRVDEAILSAQGLVGDYGGAVQLR